MSNTGYRDFGSKPGSGGVASQSVANIQRRERLQQLALETIDLEKDPYLLKNHLGKYECKLCLTLHSTIGNYLAHTQGRRHKYNLQKRMIREQKDNDIGKSSQGIQKQKIFRKTLKIGRPGYTVVKRINPESKQKSLVFQIQYPEIEKELQPRFRVMSSFEQKKEPPNPKYQYLLFAAEPYETIAFKIPNKPIDRSEGKLISDWDKEKCIFTLKLHFQKDQDTTQLKKPIPPLIPPPNASIPSSSGIIIPPPVAGLGNSSGLPVNPRFIPPPVLSGVRPPMMVVPPPPNKGGVVPPGVKLPPPPPRKQ